jgi:hypothetical protein
METLRFAFFDVVQRGPIYTGTFSHLNGCETAPFSRKFDLFPYLAEHLLVPRK